MPENSAIVEQNAVEVPLYTYLDVARYLRVPLWAAFAPAGRGHFHPEELFHQFMRWPLFTAWLAEDFAFPFRDNEPRRVSFRTLATLFVYSFIFRISPTRERVVYWHGDEGRTLFESAWDTFRRPESDSNLFADPDLDRITNKFDQYMTRFAGGSRDDLKKLIAIHLARVELRDDIPVRLFPFSRDPSLDAPRVVVIDPEIRFGRPTVKGAPTDVLAERWRAGDSSAYLAEDYNLTTAEIDEALRYESTPYPYQFPFPFPFFG